MQPRIRLPFPLLALLAGLAPAGCGDDDHATPDGGMPDSSTGIRAECNPLQGGGCLLPLPSSAYLVADTASATGYRVSLPTAAMPTNLDGITFDPAPLNRGDGWSPNGLIVIGFSTGVSPVGLPGPEDLADSLAPDSPIVLLDMDANERIPFFAEVDLNVEEPRDRALLIRPVIRMKPRHRIAVAIRKSVHGLDGGALPIPAAFQAMVDGRPFDHPLMQKVAPSYPALFAALEVEGVAKADLVVAWDYVTASDESLTRDLLTMRDDFLTRVMDDGANLTFDAVDGGNLGHPERVYRFVVGKYDSPVYLTNREADDSILARDPATGAPEFQEMYRADFAALLPACVATTRPVGVILFGHGLFGDAAGSLDSSLVQMVANDNCVVLVGGDFIGLSNDNFSTAALSVNDLNKGKALTEKLPQAVINFMALARILRGPMRQHALFQVGGEVVIDPTQVFYYGASLGGIMGGVFLAYEPDIERGALGVPGANWSMLFERSLAWSPLKIAMQAAYPDPFVYPTNILLMGTSFDPYDPITTAERLVSTTNPMPGVPAKKIFLYEGLEDSLVTGYSTEMLARTMKVPVTGPSLPYHQPFGLTESLVPVPAGFTILDEHPMPPHPVGNVGPTDDNGTHGGVNERASVQAQVRHLMLQGEVVHKCELAGVPAPCDCATAACGVRIGD